MRRLILRVVDGNFGAYATFISEIIQSLHGIALTLKFYCTSMSFCKYFFRRDHWNTFVRERL